MGRGTHRGFITYEELNKSLGKRNLSDENLEQAFIHILDENVALVEKKSDFKVLRKKENSSKDEGKTIEKSDDPIRMYLREMGGVELLSREGEIAIAKRIEAGKNVMTNGLFQSPITARKVFEWKEKLEKNELLVREIIDIDSTYMDIEGEGGSNISSKNKSDEKKQTNKLGKTNKISKEAKAKDKDKDSEEEEENKNPEDVKDILSKFIQKHVIKNETVTVSKIEKGKKPNIYMVNTSYSCKKCNNTNTFFQITKNKIQQKCNCISRVHDLTDKIITKL